MFTHDRTDSKKSKHLEFDHMGCFVSVAEFDSVVTELERKHSDHHTQFTQLRTEVTRISETLHHQINVSAAERKEFKASITRTADLLRKAEADRKQESERLKEELNAFSLKIQKEQQELRNADGKRLQDILKKEEESRKSDTMMIQFDVERVNQVLEMAQEEREEIEASLNADKANGGWYHPGDWVMQMHKGKFLEHWTCCQEIGRGNRFIRGCKKRAPPEPQFVPV